MNFRMKQPGIAIVCTEDVGLGIINAIAEGKDQPRTQSKEPTVLGLEYDDGTHETFNCTSPRAALSTLEALEAYIEKHDRAEIVWWMIRPERLWWLAKREGRDIQKP